MMDPQHWLSTSPRRDVRTVNDHWMNALDKVASSPQVPTNGAAGMRPPCRLLRDGLCYVPWLPCAARGGRRLPVWLPAPLAGGACPHLNAPLTRRCGSIAGADRSVCRCGEASVRRRPTARRGRVTRLRSTAHGRYARRRARTARGRAPVPAHNLGLVHLRWKRSTHRQPGPDPRHRADSTRSPRTGRQLAIWRWSTWRQVASTPTASLGEVILGDWNRAATRPAPNRHCTRCPARLHPPSTIGGSSTVKRQRQPRPAASQPAHR